MNTSVPYTTGRKIMNNSNRWECDENDSKYVIYIDNEDNIRIAQLKPDGDEWYVESSTDHSMWFGSYSSAKKYMTDECYVEGRFKKVKSE